MKSKASIDGHPLHPILVSFPIAFFTGTVIADVAAVALARPTLVETGMYLNAAGILFALVAAVPGILDYCFTVPPASSAKKRATIHGMLNVSVVIIFAAALAIKYSASPFLWAIALECLGFMLLGIAGYMGGTLVYRNQIGIYNRYAEKGKWNESTAKKTGTRVNVATTDELKTDQMKLVHVDGLRIVIGKTATGYVAFDDRCPHKGGSLAGGVVICDTVQCPWHGSQFDVRSGMVKAGPATEKIKTYGVKTDGSILYLEL